MTREEARIRIAHLMRHAHSVMSNESREELNECMKILDPDYKPDPDRVIERVTG